MADLSFDDLIPAGPAKSNGGLSFDDLVPTKKPPKQTQPKRTLVDEITGGMANVNRGLGIGDELAAAGGVVTGLFTGRHKLTDPAVGAYQKELAAQRGREDTFAAERPRAAALARGTGNALTMAAPVGPGAAAFATGGRAVNALRGATVAGLSGAGFAAVDRGTAQERLGAASRASYDPATLALGGAAGAIAAKPRAGKPPAPTLDELTIAKNDAYRAVDESGVAYSADDFKTLTSDMIADLKAARFNPRKHQKAAIQLDEFTDLANQAAGHTPTLSELDDLRQVIGRDVSSSPDPGERMMGEIMRKRIDTFIDSIGGEGSDDILRARDLNTRVSKLRTLDGLDEAAVDRAATGGTGSNIDNTTRQNVRRFKDKARNLTPAEEAAASRVIRGTPTQNALRAVGRLSPEGGTVSAVGSLVTGAASNGAIPAVGFVARRVADAMTTRNVRALRDLIAEGGIPVADEIERALIAAGADDLLQQLANDLSATAGVQGASAQGAARTYAEPR